MEPFDDEPTWPGDERTWVRGWKRIVALGLAILLVAPAVLGLISLVW